LNFVGVKIGLREQAVQGPMLSDQRGRDPALVEAIPPVIGAGCQSSTFTCKRAVETPIGLGYLISPRQKSTRMSRMSGKQSAAVAV